MLLFSIADTRVFMHVDQDEFRHPLELKSKIVWTQLMWGLRRDLEGPMRRNKADHSNCHQSSDTQRKMYFHTGRDEMAELLQYRNPITSLLGAT